jgi:HPt (histidine-containing phosphotransfer) domain-containing protein
MVGSMSEQKNGFVKYLETLDQEDREDLMMVADIFVRTFREDIVKLQQALSVNDYKQCYFMAHNYKSVVGHFCQEASVSLATALEHACEKESEQEVHALATELIESIETLAQEIKTQQQELGPTA